MVNKNSPWYLEDDYVPVDALKSPKDEPLEFHFNSENEKLKFLMRSDQLKSKEMIDEKLLKTKSSYFIAQYLPEIDILSINPEIQIGYFRCVKNEFTFIEIPFD